MNTAAEDKVVEVDFVMQDDEESLQDIDLLPKHGISEKDIEKLNSVGIRTVKGIQRTNRRALRNIKGLSKAKVEKIKDAAEKVLPSGLQPAVEYSTERKRKVFHITTGSQEIDKLMGGGMESMAITEAFGDHWTGKTQLSHTLCVTALRPVTAQLPGENGYTGGKVIFIDTEHTFRPDRLKDIAERFNVDHGAVLENLVVAQANNSEHLMELLDQVEAKFHKERGVYKLLIIDSIMALFRVDFPGRGKLAEMQQNLAQMLSRLQEISRDYNVAVFITNGNQAGMTSQADPISRIGVPRFSTRLSLRADPMEPVGGHILAHASTTRISLRRGRGELIIANIISPDMPENEATFVITAGGVADAKK